VAGKGSCKEAVSCGVCDAVGLKRKEEVMGRVAYLMTEKFVATKQCQGKCTDKMHLERDTTTYFVSVCTPLASADSNPACAFMNSKIQSNMAHIERITK
jgi:hypothetical protein